MELSFEINEAMTAHAAKLLENFDDEVREKLRVRDEVSKAYLNRFERMLMQLTRLELADCAEFIDDFCFRLKRSPFGDAIALGLYELPRRTGEAHLYRLNHPLAEALLERAKERRLAPVEVKFDYGQHDGKVSILEPLRGRSGWLTLSRFSVESFDQAEDHLIFAGQTDDGAALDEQALSRLFNLPGVAGQSVEPSPGVADALDATTTNEQRIIQRTISERNARFFEAEAEKLEGWADDLKLGLEREIKDLDRQVKEARRAATTALTLEEKLAGQKQIKSLEVQRNEKRKSLFDAQDQVDRHRDELIASIEGKLSQKVGLTNMFTIRWRLQ